MHAVPGIEVVELDVEHIELQPLHEQPTLTLLDRIAKINAASAAFNAN